MSIDWEAIEREYRAGQLSVREIARQFGVSHVAIGKKAKANGWARDLAKDVRAEVTNRLVTESVTDGNARAAIDAAASRVVELVRQHRGSLGRANRIVEKLLDELEEGTDKRGEIEDEVERVAAEEGFNAARRDAMRRAVSLPSRAMVARELSQTLKNLIPLERQAFNLDARDDHDGGGADGQGAFEAFTKALDGIASRKSSGPEIQGGLAERGEGVADHP